MHGGTSQHFGSIVVATAKAVPTPRPSSGRAGGAQRNVHSGRVRLDMLIHVTWLVMGEDPENLNYYLHRRWSLSAYANLPVVVHHFWVTQVSVSDVQPDGFGERSRIAEKPSGLESVFASRLAFSLGVCLHSLWIILVCFLVFGVIPFPGSSQHPCRWISEVLSF
jgi:hypothetical protein